MLATVTVFNCDKALQITGPIVRRYAKGLTINSPSGVWYATMERVKLHDDDQPRRPDDNARLF